MKQSFTFRLDAPDLSKVTVSDGWMVSESFSRASKDMEKGEDGGLTQPVY